MIVKVIWQQHVGIRGPIFGDDDGDLKHDKEVGFKYIMTEDIDEHITLSLRNPTNKRIGTEGIIKKIHKRIGDQSVYLSIDIDVLDPVFGSLSYKL